MTNTEQVNEFRIQAYDEYLKCMTKSELLAYFNDMSMKDMIECVKFTYGNDGKDDGVFEY